MLRNMNELENYAIHATDGSIGHVRDFYFDDKHWVIRYLVIDTGGWMPNRKVLISPMSIIHAGLVDKDLSVSITKEQVKNSPDIDTDKPVSRQHEEAYLGYYGYPYYWGGAGLWGAGMFPYTMMTGAGRGSSSGLFPTIVAQDGRELARESGHGNPHLRSCNEVIGYHIDATDGDIGQVKGLLVDEDTWAIRYLIVETGKWWHGHEVLVVPQWIDSVSWLDCVVSVNVTRQAVKDAPPYRRDRVLERPEEISTHDHYGRVGYWIKETGQHEPESRK